MHERLPKNTRTEISFVNTSWENLSHSRWSKLSAWPLVWRMGRLRSINRPLHMGTKKKKWGHVGFDMVRGVIIKPWKKLNLIVLNVLAPWILQNNGIACYDLNTLGSSNRARRRHCGKNGLEIFDGICTIVRVHGIHPWNAALQLRSQEHGSMANRPGWSLFGFVALSGEWESNALDAGRKGWHSKALWDLRVPRLKPSVPALHGLLLRGVWLRLRLRLRLILKFI